MMDKNVENRIHELGVLGEVLWGQIVDVSLPVEAFTGMSLANQTVCIGRLAVDIQAQIPNPWRSVSHLYPVVTDFEGSGKWERTTVLLPCALSLLLARYPVQLPPSMSGVETMLLNCIWRSERAAISHRVRVPLDLTRKWGVYDHDGVLLHGRCIRSSLTKREVGSLEEGFPCKPYPQATLKANVHLDDLLLGAEEEKEALEVSELMTLLYGRATDDQVCAAILYWHGAFPILGRLALAVTVLSLVKPDAVKAIGACIKALGLNNTARGAVLCELGVLQGRGVGTIDLAKASYDRTTETWVDDHVVNVDEGELRRIVRLIVKEELGDEAVNFQTPKAFWNSRWLWCVNGAHNRSRDASIGVQLERSLPGVDRYYRRMFAEACQHEPLTGWDGVVECGASAKLEHGKTRAIFACDTLSYFAFEHLLGPVSASWRNRRVILDPGKYGHLGMYERIRKMIGSGGTNLMLDYDDFNSQHSTTSMKIVFEELVAATGYDTKLGAKLVASFDKTYMRVPGSKRRVLGTLMSGHRATTMVNSILNAAYIRLAIGEAAYSQAPAQHVGDDVFMAAPTVDDACAILDAVRRLGCRANPAKQSIGSRCAEFLRMAMDERGAWGYLSRAVASCVSGNWVSDVKLDGREGLTAMVTNARALSNRSGGKPFGKLLSRSVCAVSRLKRRAVVEILDGTAALGDGPVFNTFGYIKRYELSADDAERVKWDEGTLREAPAYATTAYLTEAAAAVERAGLELAKRSVRTAMLESSYKKALASVRTAPVVQYNLTEKRRQSVRGSDLATDLLYKPKGRGLLEPYPVLQLLKKQLNTESLRKLCKLVTGGVAGPDVETEAWGVRNKCVIIQGSLSYTDACVLAQRSTGNVILVRRPINF